MSRLWTTFFVHIYNFFMEETFGDSDFHNFSSSTFKKTKNLVFNLIGLKKRGF